MDQLFVYVGIVAYTMIVFSVLTGLRVIKVKYIYHKWIGLTGLSVASVHAFAMIYFNVFQ